MATLSAFTKEEAQEAKILLATTVAKMMGRKFEEGDWASVYCGAKNIPLDGWSNLHIDVMHNGLGVEHKMLCVSGDKTLLSVAGTSMMHPSATRSIRIDSTDVPPEDAMRSVFAQYSDLLRRRADRVRESSKDGRADMRTGWLLWERSLTEFLYFEEETSAPDPEMYWAEWNVRSAMGARKQSKNLWIYERGSNKKKFSVTTSAGIKIQPYFDVPSPADNNLHYFRVQSEPLENGFVRIWIAAETATRLKRVLSDDTLETLSQRILTLAAEVSEVTVSSNAVCDLAVPVTLTRKAHEAFKAVWPGVSDEHGAQLLLRSISG
jgi:hypothetical protein